LARRFYYDIYGLEADGGNHGDKKRDDYITVVVPLPKVMKRTSGLLGELLPHNHDTTSPMFCCCTPSA